MLYIHSSAASDTEDYAGALTADGQLVVGDRERIVVTGHTRDAMTESPRITVVIPSFNQAEYLGECIESVLGQGYPDLELIVMDGGSTDGSVDIIRRYADRLSFWCSEPDGGQYAAIEAGLRRSTGDIMTWINSDDRLHPGALDVAATVFARRADVRWLTGRPNTMYQSGEQATVSEFLPLFSHALYLQGRINQPLFIQQEGTFWRRDLWEEAGGHMEAGLTLAGDMELWARFFRYTPLHTVNALLGCFRSQAQQKTRGGLDDYFVEAATVIDRERAWMDEQGRRPFAPVRPVFVRYDTRPAWAPAEAGARTYRVDGPTLVPLEEPFEPAEVLAAVTPACTDYVAALRSLADNRWRERDVRHALAYIQAAVTVAPEDADTVTQCATMLECAGFPDLAARLHRAHRAGAGETGEPAAVRVEPGGEPWLVTAVVSTCDAERLLPGCLEDLERQTIADRLEIIVVDSGSSQGEAAVVERLQQRYGNIRYLRTEQRETVYAAWNRGIEAARGRYVTNANTDDAHHPRALEMLVEALEGDGAADLAYGDCVWTDVANDRFEDGNGYRRVDYPDYEPRLGLLYCLLGPHPLWRRDVFDRIGRFDARLRAAGDYEFQLRFIEAGLNAMHVPEPLSLFCQNREGITLSSGRSAQETGAVNEHYRMRIPIERLYAVDENVPGQTASAWVAQGDLAADFACPWEDRRQSDRSYAVWCYQQALARDPGCPAALNNLVRVVAEAGRWSDCERLLQAAGHVPPELADAVRRRRVPDAHPVEAAPYVRGAAIAGGRLRRAV